MSYEKKYGVGNVFVDTPYAHFVHELPLLSFGDVQHNINVSLIFQSKESGNPFNIANGYKLNLQKRLIMNGNIPEKFEDGNGKHILLNNCSNTFVFDDGSQRIIRAENSAFVLENPDYSKEVYDDSGRITQAWDKYGNKYLTYSYVNNTNMLNRVEYRNKTIQFSYSGTPAKLQSLQYICHDETICTITFEYPEEEKVFVHHYSGVDYRIAYSNSRFEVYSTDVGEEDRNQNSCQLICESASNLLTITKMISNTVIDRTTYNFYFSSQSGKLYALEVTDFNGVKTRTQFKDEKPTFSYEMTGNMFDHVLNPDDHIIYPSTYFGDVTHYANGQAAGVQEYKDGIKMAYRTSQNEWFFITPPTGAEEEETNLEYIVVSGWLKRESASAPNTIEIDFSNLSSSYGNPVCIEDLPLGQWTYFSTAVGVSQLNNLTIGFNRNSSQISTKDFRVTPYYKDNSNNNSHIPAMQNVLFVTDTNSTAGSIPIYLQSVGNSQQAQITFYNGSIEINQSDYPITENDIVKYIINQAYGTHKNEIYFNNCRGVIPNAGELRVRYSDANRTTPILNVKDAAIEKRYSHNGNTYATRIFFPNNESPGLCVQNSFNGRFYKNTRYDENHLDVVFSKYKEISTFYVRNNYGLLTLQAISIDDDDEVWTTSISYDSDCTKVLSTTDEFDQTTTYVTDDVWGIVTEVHLSDGTVIRDAYDGDMSTLCSKTFVKGDRQRVHTLNYSNGYCSEMSDGMLTYMFENGFANANEEYNNVIKFNSTIEHHKRYLDIRTVVDCFPDEDHFNYMRYQVFDVYGRLTHIAGAIQNHYDVDPKCRQGDACASGFNNASSKLASSTYCNSLLNDEDTTTKTKKYEYDSGRVSKIGEFASDDTPLNEETFTYDSLGRLTKDEYVYDLSANKSVSSVVEYNTSTDEPSADSKVKKYTYKVNNGSEVKTSNTYDSRERLEKKDVLFPIIAGFNMQKEFTYDKTRVKTVANKYVTRNTNLGTSEYSYDSQGRIEQEIYVSDTSVNYNKSYLYDEFGQLIRENNEALDKTFIYEYNDIGNLTRVGEYEYYAPDEELPECRKCVIYTHDTLNLDRLVSVDDNSVTYNSLGCLESYKGKTYSWKKGMLEKVQQGNKTEPNSAYEECAFTYDGYGRRTQKYYITGFNDSSYNYSRERTTEYSYDNSGGLIREFCTDVENGITTTHEFIYLYDETGMIGVMYSDNGTTPLPYYYHRNLQGDVIALCDAGGNKQVEYAYDAWGNCTVIFGENDELASLNPIRYRGYYYDAETGLYYLNARYYSPEWRRFISPDAAEYIDPESINGLNLYAYCNNDPVNYADPSGHDPEWWQWALLGVGAALVVVAAGMAIWGTGGVAAFGMGALIGSVAVGSVGAVAGGVVGYATGGVEGILGGVLTGFGIGSIVGFAVGGAIGYHSFATVSSHTHSVYISKSGNTVNYAGRTNNVIRRTAEHKYAARGVVPQEVAKKLTLKQARGLEQALINRYGLSKNGGTLINEINSIAISNPIYNQAVLFGRIYILTHFWKFPNP